MAETYNDGATFSVIRSRFNGNANELNTANQAILDLQAQYNNVTSRLAALESGGGNQGPVSDGTATSFPFFRVDGFNFAYQTTGSSGQQFVKDNVVAGFSDTGYAATNNIAGVEGTAALAYYNGFATDSSRPEVQVPRKVYMRLYGVTGATLRGESNSQGATGTATLTQTNVWHWVEMSQPHAALDNQYQLIGRSANVLLDKIVLTSTDNPDVPTGKDGFTAAS